jgi:hypothetical protein
VDHVVAWSRTHNDAIENLVLCDSKCNEKKSDRLPSATLIFKYLEYLDMQRARLVAGAEGKGLMSDRRATLLALHAAILYGPSEAECFDVIEGESVVRTGSRTEWLTLLPHILSSLDQT